MHELTCQICSEEFDRVEHVPCACALCGNSVCILCLRSIASKAINGSFNCPNCRQPHRLDQDRPTGFPINKNLLSLLDKLDLSTTRPCCLFHPANAVSYCCIDPKCKFTQTTFCGLCMPKHADCSEGHVMLMADLEATLAPYAFPVDIKVWQKSQKEAIDAELKQIKKELFQLVDIAVDHFSSKFDELNTFSVNLLDSFKGILSVEKIPGQEKFRLQSPSDGYFRELAGDLGHLFQKDQLWKEVRLAMNQKVAFWSRKLFSDPSETPRPVHQKTLAKIKKINPFIQRQYFLAGLTSLFFDNTEALQSALVQCFEPGVRRAPRGSMQLWTELGDPKKDQGNFVKAFRLSESELVDLGRKVVENYGSELGQIEEQLADELQKRLTLADQDVRVYVLPNEAREAEEDISQSWKLTLAELTLRIALVGK